MGYLDKLDLDKKLESKEEYEELLEEYQLRLLKLQRKIIEKGIPVCVTYEGEDAAGKGGNIKRLTEALDPRGYEVYPIGAPSEEDKAHHWLRRFWLRLPPGGRIAIFDRTWYGRVLVERVEKFAKKEEWQRAYREINEFERTLVDSGMVLVKFWIHISKKEQLDRFKKREKDPWKNYKLTEDDWRNREKWDQYIEALEDMFAKTDTDYAPWTIIEGDWKWWARVKALKTVVNKIEART
ncbi:MAG: UDP-galactose-lipid carrier transferase [Terriglobia bacterium]|jgi:polyphosphate kinase 2 (PPK2 family)